MARKPLVEVASADEFGHIDPNDPGINMETGGRDITYVPGFSDLRRERDLAIAEVVHGERNPKSVPTLPVNCRWARFTTYREQKPDGTKIAEHALNGYRLATKDDVGQEWLREMPAGSKVLADGSIAQGDTVLMVVSADVAARNRMRSRRKLEGQLDAVGTEIVSEAKKAKSEGFVEKTVGKATTLGSGSAGAKNK